MTLDGLARKTTAQPSRRFGATIFQFCQQYCRGFPIASALVFGVLSVAMFAGILLSGKDIVWSASGTDLTTQLVPWWKFGYSEMSHGNLPLWNPHNFCGTPFFSNFNPGLLYPPHLLNLLLPLKEAINLIAVINVFLAGWLTALWCRGRGVSAMGAILGGVIFMFSGAYFQHSYAGHEPPMAAMALTPLVFLCIDGILRDLGWRWCLLGAFAVGMQILAGFPQAVYYTGLMGGLYLLLRLTQVAERRRVLLLFVLMYFGGTLLGAVQLYPGMQTAGESVRAGGNSLEFDEECPMPPENLLQLLGPVFGDRIHADYIGRWFPWEVSLFCGITTLVLAGYGWIYGGGRRRGFSGTLLVVSTVAAISVYLRIGGKPILFEFLYYVVPMFSTFRVLARFNWFMTLHLAMLAAIGFDVLLVAARTSWRPVMSVAIAALFIGMIALWCQASAQAGIDGDWGRIARALVMSKDHIIPFSGQLDDGFAIKTGAYAGTQLLFSAGTLLMMCVALALLRVSARFNVLLAAVTIGELVIFANGILAHGPMYQPYPPNWTAATEAASPDGRVLHPTLEFPNTAMIYGYDDVYGYDPVTLKRFADFCAATQDQDPDESNFVTQIQRIRYPKLLQLLRCQLVCFMRAGTDNDGNRVRVPETLRVDSPMPHLLLVSEYAIGRSRSAIFADLRDPRSNLRRTVFLESRPDPAPAQPSQSAAAGTATIVRSSTDWMEIEADLPAAAILLVTDSYSKYWRAKSIEPGPQSNYNVMPADYTLRAIPMAAGHHHIILEYAPIGYKVGKWISIFSLLAWIVLVIRFRGQGARDAEISHRVAAPSPV